MQVYWKGSVHKRNSKIQVNCAQSCNMLSGMCANVLSPRSGQGHQYLNIGNCE